MKETTLLRNKRVCEDIDMLVKVKEKHIETAFEMVAFKYSLELETVFKIYKNRRQFMAH